MSSSYQPNVADSPKNPTAPLTWSQWGDNVYRRETVVFKSQVPLAISTALTTAIYSYTMIDGSTNNAINRALLMSLSTFVGGSLVNILENNNYISSTNMDGRYVEAALIPLVYYYINQQQFQLPDLQSQAIKTGVIASVVGEFASPTVSSYYDTWNTPSSVSATSPATPQVSTK
jgi:hypothetical protein